MVAHSPAHPTFDHLWFRFSQGIDEVINARVWEGIHFRNSDEQGMRARAGAWASLWSAMPCKQRRSGTESAERRPESDDDLGCDDLGGSQSNDATSARTLDPR